MEEPAGKNRWAALGVGLAPLLVLLCGLTYLLSTPVGGAPDEVSHFVRVVGLSDGVLFGDAVPLDTPYGPLTGEQLEAVNLDAGYFDVPSGVQTLIDCTQDQDASRPWTCPVLGPDSGAVRAISHHARTSPVPYFLPAALSQFGGTSTSKFYLARVGFLLQNTLLAFVAALALQRTRLRWRPSVLGAVLLSITPVFLWQTGLLAPNSTELYGLVAFTASFLAALAHPASNWWIAATAVGALAVSTRDLGFVYVPSIVLFTLVFRWSRDRLRMMRARHRLVGSVVIAVTSILGAVWRLVVTAPAPQLDLSVRSIWTRVERLRTLSIDSIGRVGVLDIPTQSFVAALWATAFVVVVLWKAARSVHWAKVLGAMIAYWSVANIVLNLVISAKGFTWFGTQARYTAFVPVVFVLIGAATAPPPSGESRLIARIERSCAVPLATAVTSAAHFLTSVHVHHRWANGLADGIGFRRAVWSPPGGWGVVLVLSAVATLAYLVGLILWSDRLRRDRPALLS